MKKLFTVLAAVFFTVGVFAQPPEKISYQAVIRDQNNNLVTNQAVGMKISIFRGSTIGTIVYEETYNPKPTTNANGLVTVEIGGGIPLRGTFSTIDWSSGTYKLMTAIDPEGGTNYTITGSSQILSVPYALHAKTAESVTGTKTYSVGDFAHGGIVFWVDETGQHGLVCAKADQSDGVRWYAGTFGNTQAKGDGPYAGKANTSIIISAQVAIGDDGNTYAARICNELQITENGITYGDWYLPSKEELNLMYQNRAKINATAASNGGSGFTNGKYWSSTEIYNNDAWDQSFAFGSQFTNRKNDSNRVRAVRAF